MAKKGLSIGGDVEVEVMMVKSMPYSEALKVRASGNRKGWFVKIGEKDLFSRNNKL